MAANLRLVDSAPLIEEQRVSRGIGLGVLEITPTTPLWLFRKIRQKIHLSTVHVTQPSCHRYKCEQSAADDNSNAPPKGYPAEHAESVFAHELAVLGQNAHGNDGSDEDED